MTKKRGGDKQEKDLRVQAEELERKNSHPGQENPEALFPEETRRVLHELRLHQIELEMQNEELRRAQAELENAHARYFELYDLAPVGYLTLSEEGMILEANLAAATRLGVTRTMLVGKPITRFILKEDQDIFYRHRKLLFATGEPQCCELRMQTSPEIIFWARLEAIAAAAGDGAPVCRVIMTDISERKNRQEDLNLAANLSNLENRPGNFQEWISRLTKNLQSWSGCEAVGIRLRSGDDYPYYATVGLPPEFVEKENSLCDYGTDGEIRRDDRGNPVLECMCGNILRGRVDPALPFFTDYGSFWSSHTSALLAGTSEADRQSRTRNRCNSEGYESVALIPLYDNQEAFGLLQFNDHRKDIFSPTLIGRLERMAANLAPAILRRQYEEELLEAKVLIENIVDILPIRIFWKDRDLVFLGCNSAFARDAGFSDVKDIIGKDDYQMVWRDQAELYRADDREVIASGKPKLLIEEPQTNSEGKTIILLTNKVPLHNLNGEICGILGAYMEITEQKRLEAEQLKLRKQLAESQKLELVGRLAGGVAHDFNNMLGVILGQVDLALTQVKPEHPLYEGLLDIRQAADRSVQTTKQLLTFARGQTIEPKILNLNETVGLLLTTVIQISGESINLQWLPGDDLWPILMDISQIEQLLVNLCVNARDALTGNEQGRISIETGNSCFDAKYCAEHADFLPGEYVRLSVSDNGQGMDRETMARIFEPFFSTKGVKGGSGLGLATAYGIIKQNNGFINVYSEPGVGTTFNIYLPRHKASSSQAQTAAAEKTAGGGRETILLVEDEPAILNVAERMLKLQGYTVLAAPDPDKAILLAREHRGKIHLLITDVVMPGISCRELAETILALHPTLKCLFMSGYTAEIITHDNILDPEINFIEKPFSTQKLAAKVRDILDRS